jgi:hypothetical protein
MQRFCLFAVAVLMISGATAHADPFVRLAAADPESAPSPSDIVPFAVVAYPDYPPYPPGFSSYRGLGFVGFCCEPVSPCALHAWDGYCEEKARCESEPQPSFLEKLHAWLCRPACTCCPQSCTPCVTDSCVKDWPVRLPHCQGKLQRLRGPFAGIPGAGDAKGESWDKDTEPTASGTTGCRIDHSRDDQQRSQSRSAHSASSRAIGFANRFAALAQRRGQLLRTADKNSSKSPLDADNHNRYI